MNNVRTQTHMPFSQAAGFCTVRKFAFFAVFCLFYAALFSSISLIFKLLGSQSKLTILFHVFNSVNGKPAMSTLHVH